MTGKIKVGFVGYGNVTEGIIKALANNPFMELVCGWSRRPEAVVKKVNVPVYPYRKGEPVVIAKEEPQVVFLCGGSKKDLREMGPAFARCYNTVDSFDTHGVISEYREDMSVACGGFHVAVICVGWDPGIFSILRVLLSSFLPGYKVYAFYGKRPQGGLSMGHSDALRTIPGVIDGRSYTHAYEEAIAAALRGDNPELTDREMHWRENFVVVEDGAEKAAVERQIKDLEHYFAPYNTTVHFISAEDLANYHRDMKHDGCVIVSGETSPGKRATYRFDCELDSNPEATGSIMVSYAFAAARMAELGQSGVWTPIDIAPWMVAADPELAVKKI